MASATPNDPNAAYFGTDTSQPSPAASADAAPTIAPEIRTLGTTITDPGYVNATEWYLNDPVNPAAGIDAAPIWPPVHGPGCDRGRRR